MFSLMDRYIYREFLRTFVAFVSLFCLLVVMGRFFDKMQVFNTFHAKPTDILVFLALALPYWLNMVLPIATLLALLFSMGDLQQHGEITAFRSGGIPNLRLFLPYFVSGLILTIISLISSLHFLPQMSASSRKVYKVQIKKEVVMTNKRDHFVATGRDNRRFTIGALDTDIKEMKDVVVDRFNSRMQPLETISARKAIWNESSGWVFSDGMKIEFEPETAELRRQTTFNSLAVAIPEEPKDFLFEEVRSEDLSVNKIRARVKHLRQLGIASYKERTTYHLKFALPFANLIMILLGIPFALKSAKKGRAQTFAIALFIAFFYWGAVSVFQSIGDLGYLWPGLAAWCPNAIFLAVGVYLFRKHANG